MARDAQDHDDPPAPPDPHGQAAWLLAESILHALRARGVLNHAETVEVVETAIEVKADVADDWGDTPETMARSLGMLSRLALSLRLDD